MSNSQPSTEQRRGLATREELEELHGLVVRELLKRLSPKSKRRPGVDLLAVVGTMLKQEGTHAPTEAARKDLERLYGLYCKALVRHLEDPRPSAAILGEVRTFLRAQGIEKDPFQVVNRQGLAKALGGLAGLEVPFKVH